LGHGYYGCAGCCGYAQTKLAPSPLSGAVSTGAGDAADALDGCNEYWYDVTSEAYNWASTNSGIVKVANAYSNFMSPGSVTGSAQVKLQNNIPRMECPVITREPQNTQNACSISVTRSNLTQTSATGSPANLAANPAFTYNASGSGTIATYTTSNANANPNTATIGGTTNSGAPEPGGLGTLQATYNCSGGSASQSFQVPTFGLSCYSTQLETDYLNGGSCTSITISGVTYSGSSNPSGIPAEPYCNSFLGMVRLNGSGQSQSGTKIAWQSGSYPNWTFSVISQFLGADGTPVVANATLARDRSIVPLSTTVQLPGGNYSANDIGGGITGYRLDIYMGLGNGACAGFQNNVVVGACSPGVSTCPAQAIQ